MSNNLNVELDRQAQEIRELERQLLEDINAKRIAKGKEPIVIDEYFIDELSKKLEKNIIV